MLRDLQLDHHSHGVPAIALFVLAVVVCQIIVKRLVGHEAIKRWHVIARRFLEA